ncbi:Glycine--tRNA ligase [Lamellibrachia satsuma]|nr:Glycine--tRNA ligase [Lamellibrachia satsuma]
MLTASLNFVSAYFEKVLADKKANVDLKKEIQILLPRVDGMSKDDMQETIRKYNMKAPVTGNDLTDPHEFNLMFSTSIGPGGYMKGFLRPETAQGIFVNFKRLLDFNQGKLPFAGAQIGTAFRNEISPRSGLIRVREFQMAEIEHFCDPEDKSHPKFDVIKDVVVPLYSACGQMDGQLPEMWTFGDAVDKGLIANQTLAYFMCRIYLFLVKIGIDKTKFRFRQHMANEMAHYACDCWDAEMKTTYGWVECVGCADRSCYDLSQHTNGDLDLVNVEKEVVEAAPNKGLLGKEFKKDAKEILESLSKMDEGSLNSLETAMKENGEYKLKVGEREVTLKSDMVPVKRYTKKVHVEEIVPSVVEPSYGVGRIVYALLEHNFWMREGEEQRTYLALPPVIAPYKCSVLPLSNNPEFTSFVKQISMSLTQHDVSHKVDASSGSIGRRYARTDQIAIPFGITIDFDTVKAPHSATLRERDSMKQIRAEITELPKIVSDLSNGKRTWEDVLNNYPLFEQQESTK